MKIALVHDYLSEAGGAERVLTTIAKMYPEAPIYTAFAKKGTALIPLQGRDIRESKWAPILKIGRMYSYLRFLLPFIWRSIDLSEYDVIITSCSGYIARGFKLKTTAKLVAYCHTPPRWLYDYETPTGAKERWWGKVFMWFVGPWIRYFDYQSAQRVDKWIANSEEVKMRITKFYRKEAQVIYPPIEIPKGKFSNYQNIRDYYLVVSRLVGGKGIEEAIAGAVEAKAKLKIVGERVGGVVISANDKIEYLGRVEDEQLSRLYREARGFIALAKDEDFGMTVVEAMSYGVPVLAYFGGGYKESVVEGVNGLFVRSLKIRVIAEGIKKMEATKWNREKIMESARRFDKENFVVRFKKAVTE